MGDDNKAKTLLNTVLGEVKAAKIKAAQGVIKGLLAEREKALAVVNGIDEKIAEQLAGIGASESEIEEVMSSLS